jgi:hypothetical protein
VPPADSWLPLPPPRTHPRRKFRFPLRDLFWLTLIAAIAVGWGIDYGRSRYERAAVMGQSATLNDLQPRRVFRSRGKLLSVDEHLAESISLLQAEPREYPQRLGKWIDYQRDLLEKLYALRKNAR